MFLGQNLGQIMSNVMKIVKKQVANIIRFFSYFTWDHLLKQEAVVVKPPELKFIWVKSDEKLIIFNNFTLVSQS